MGYSDEALRLTSFRKTSNTNPAKEVNHEEPKTARYLGYLALCFVDDCHRGRYKLAPPVNAEA
jgi:hypothetical protein